MGSEIPGDALEPNPVQGTWGCDAVLKALGWFCGSFQVQSPLGLQAEETEQLASRCLIWAGLVGG